jgi:hypothetical protein
VDQGGVVFLDEKRVEGGLDEFHSPKDDKEQQ